VVLHTVLPTEAKCVFMTEPQLDFLCTNSNTMQFIVKRLIRMCLDVCFSIIMQTCGKAILYFRYICNCSFLCFWSQQPKALDMKSNAIGPLCTVVLQVEDNVYWTGSKLTTVSSNDKKKIPVFLWTLPLASAPFNL
jgi:hypothetical protein